MGGSAARASSPTARSGWCRSSSPAALLSLGCAAALATVGKAGRLSQGTPGAGHRSSRRVLAAWTLVALLLLASAPVLARVAAPFVIFGSFVAAIAFAELFDGWRDASQTPHAPRACAGRVRPPVGGRDAERLGRERPPARRRPGFRRRAGARGTGQVRLRLCRLASVPLLQCLVAGVRRRVRIGLRRTRQIDPMERQSHAPWVERWLAQNATRRHEARLAADFARTPPAYVVIGNTVAAQPDAAPRSGVATLDGYLDAHCRFVRHLQPPKLETAAYTALGALCLPVTACRHSSSTSSTASTPAASRTASST
ncbi:MAG: hypothetical protein MZW92_21305 [Comamonadaceae bacterium]|nr:hypothetical protein [Comamonadaceae bacterium]